MVSGVYAAVFALVQFFLTLNVVKLRWSKKVSLGDGDHDALTRSIRGHGNFIETVPIVLLLMLIAELSGSPLWCIHVLGLLMVVSRVLHYVGVTTGTGHGKYRSYGMQMTGLCFVLGALLCLWLAWPVLLPA